MSEDLQQVSLNYDDISADYEAWYSLDWPEPVHHHGKVLQEIFENKGFKGPLNILDLTCGIGTQSLGMAIRDHHVVGMDISPKQIERAKEKEKEFSIRHPVQWIVGNAATPADHVSENFDVVLSFGCSLPVLGSEEALRSSLRQSHKLLKKGGMFSASMIDYTEVRKTKPYLLETGQLQHNGKRGVYTETAEWLPDGKHFRSHIIFVWTSPAEASAHYPFPPLIAITRNEFETLLSKEGFSDIEFMPPEQSNLYYPIYIARKN